VGQYVFNYGYYVSSTLPSPSLERVQHYSPKSGSDQRGISSPRDQDPCDDEVHGLGRLLRRERAIPVVQDVARLAFRRNLPKWFPTQKSCFIESQKMKVRSPLGMTYKDLFS